MLTIQPGISSDYLILAPFHYRAGPPATCVHVLRALVGETLAGVLVVSNPALNGAWRRVAWPGDFSTAAANDKRDAALRLNRDVRCISRVIVDPRFRGLGVARDLVRAYLARPLTPRTEAVAAMGSFCPFFESAGMRAVPVPHSRALIRLVQVFRQRKISTLDLIDRPRCIRLLARDPTLSRELRRWANDTKSLRRHMHRTPDESLAALAAASLIARPVAYVAECKVRNRASLIRT